MITCDLCGKGFNYDCLLVKHLSRKFPCYSNMPPVTNTNTFPITEEIISNCPQIKGDGDHLKLIKKKPFECKKCLKRFIHKKDHWKHIEKCTGCHPLQCPICMKTFSSTDGKSQHKRKVNCKPIYNHAITTELNSHEKGFIYMLITREFLNINQSIYKIGRTADIMKRFKQYPKGSELIFSSTCKNMFKAEKSILLRCTELFKQRKDIGHEYFEADKYELLKTIFYIMCTPGIR